MQSLVVMPPKGVSKALCFNTPGKTMPSVGEDVPEPYTWQHKVRDPLGPFASTQVAQEQLAKLRESGTRAIAAFQDEAQANRERAIYLNKLSMPYGWDTKIKVGVVMPDDLIAEEGQGSRRLAKDHGRFVSHTKPRIHA